MAGIVSKAIKLEVKEAPAPPPPPSEIPWKWILLAGIGVAGGLIYLLTKKG